MVRRSRWQQLDTAKRPYILPPTQGYGSYHDRPLGFLRNRALLTRRANVRGVDPVHVVDADTDDVVDAVGVTGGRSQTAGRRRKAFTRPRIRHHAYICR